MIGKIDKEHGRIRALIVTEDMRRFVIGRLKTRYFDAAFDFHWVRVPLISDPHKSPGMDTLNVGAIAAEELTEQEFAVRMEQNVLKKVVDEAEKIINPIKPTE
jgi:hypothetical protein